MAKKIKRNKGEAKKSLLDKQLTWELYKAKIDEQVKMKAIANLELILYNARRAVLIVSDSYLYDRAIEYTSEKIKELRTQKTA